MNNILIENIDSVHTTDMGVDRIKRKKPARDLSPTGFLLFSLSQQVLSILMILPSTGCLLRPLRNPNT